MMPPGNQKKEYRKDIVTGTSSSVIAAAVATVFACAGKVRLPVGLAWGVSDVWHTGGCKLMDKRRK